jgi:hypothetical protein
MEVFTLPRVFFSSLGRRFRFDIVPIATYLAYTTSLILYRSVVAVCALYCVRTLLLVFDFLPQRSEFNPMTLLIAFFVVGHAFMPYRHTQNQVYFSNLFCLHPYNKHQLDANIYPLFISSNISTCFGHVIAGPADSTKTCNMYQLFYINGDTS